MTVRITNKEMEHWHIHWQHTFPDSRLACKKCFIIFRKDKEQD